MYVYQVTTYEYDTYSYSGLSPYEQRFFSTEEKALRFIKDNGLRVTEGVTDTNCCTLDKVDVN